MTLYGIDISSNQEDMSMDVVKQEGFSFVTARMLSFPKGDMVEDNCYAKYRDGCKNAGLLFAAYILIHTYYTPQQHAAKALQVIGDKTIPIMIDWESDGVPSSPSYSFARQCRDELVKLGMQVVDLYAPHWYWTLKGSPALTDRPWFLTNSTYVPGPGYASVIYPGDDAIGWRAYGGLGVTKLQFADNVIVDGLQVDGDAYRGTFTQLKASGLFKDWSHSEVEVKPYALADGNGNKWIIAPDLSHRIQVTDNAFTGLVKSGLYVTSNPGIDQTTLARIPAIPHP